MAIPMGELITPSSVSPSGSATVSASSSGKVTFTNVSPTDYVTINGIFSSTYDNYLIVSISEFATGSGGDQLAAELTVSGTASTTGYVEQYLAAGGTSASGRRDSPNTGFVIADATAEGPSGYHFYLYGPALAQPTAGRSLGCLYLSGAYIFDHAGTHSASTAYDGIRLRTSSDVISGTLCVYGLSQ